MFVRMSSRLMGWARFDDKRYDHPKLVEAGLEARGLDEAAICWVAGHETDGFIPEAVVKGICAMHGSRFWQQLAAKLCAVGRWEFGTNADAITGYRIHDYLDYNPTKAQREEKREKLKQNGKLGGLASGQAKAKQNAKPVGSQAANTRPVPLVKGGRGHTSTTRSRRAPDFVGPAAPDVPIDPEAASKLRAVKNEMAERWGQKK